MNTKKKLLSPGRLALIILLTLAILLVPITLFRALSGSLIENVTKTISTQYSQDLNEQMSTHVLDSMNDHFGRLNMFFSMLPELENPDEQKLTDFIARVQERQGVDFLAFADEDGYVYSAEGSFLGTLSINMLGQLLNGESRVISDNETINGQSLVMLGASYSQAVTMFGKVIRVAMLGISHDALSDEINLNNEFSGGFSSLIHPDGSYVLKNPSVPYGGVNALEILKTSGEATDEELAGIRAAIENREPYMLGDKGADGQVSVYLYFSAIEGTDWYIINTLPGSYIRTSVTEIQTKLSIIYALIISFLIVVALVVIFLQASSAGKLAVALGAADAASKSKTAFLFNMSHDIRTPMNAILGYTEIGLRHQDDRERTRDCFEKIMASGTHLLNLINDVLEMSRVEAGKLDLDEKPLDIREAISVVGNMSHSLAVSRSIDYETIVGDIRDPYILADELHTNEVLINLISNAVKYTPDGGKVRYRIDQLGDAVDGRVTFRFEISDTGIGMSEEFQTHLFESFSREKNSTVSKIEGTGLGLSIVKRITDLMGGTIRVQSTLGKGSVFTVELSFRVLDDVAIQAFEAGKAHAEKPAPEFSFEGKRVLLVDDNELNREIALDLLQETGLIVDTAEDGDIAVKAVQEKGMTYYDFVLMDVQMPVMDGYTATRAIRAMPGGDRLPIIALSANAFEEDVKKSLQCGMNAHVPKPIDIQTLFDTMKKVIR